MDIEKAKRTGGGRNWRLNELSRAAQERWFGSGIAEIDCGRTEDFLSILE